MTSGWVARGTVYQEIRPGGTGFKTGDFAKEKLEGVTVERLPSVFNLPWRRDFTNTTPAVRICSTGTCQRDSTGITPAVSRHYLTGTTKETPAVLKVP